MKNRSRIKTAFLIAQLLIVQNLLLPVCGTQDFPEKLPFPGKYLFSGIPVYAAPAASDSEAAGSAAFAQTASDPAASIPAASELAASAQTEIASAAAPHKKISIGSAEELLALAEGCKLDTWSHNLEVTLTADIGLGNTDFSSIPTFGGTFNGNGHTISGLLVKETGAARGFFRYIQQSGVVRNLKLEGVVLSSGSRESIGGIAGVNYGRIENCSFSGTVIGRTQTGGIAGLNESTGSILNCRADGDVTGEHFTGGIAGKNLGVISSCVNGCHVNTNNPEPKRNLESFDLAHLNSTENLNSHTDTGGIVGYSSGIVKNCANLGTVGYRHTGYNVGGIAGRQNGFLSGCTNQAEVFGRKDVAGITGQAEPYLIMEFSEDTMQRLDTEVNKMHGLIDTAAGHFSSDSSLVHTQLDTLTGQFRSAGDSVHTVMNSLVAFTNGSMDAVNDAGGRIGDLTKGTDRMLGELGNTSTDLKQAMEHMDSSLGKLQEEKEVSDVLTEKVKQILALFRTGSESVDSAVSGAASAVSSLSEARSSLGSYSQEISDTVSGSTLPENEKTALLGDIESANDALSAFDGVYPAAAQKAAAAVASVSSFASSQSDALAPLSLDITVSSLQTAADSLAAGSAYADEAVRQVQELKGQIEPGVNSLTRAFDQLNGVYAGLPDTAASPVPGAPPAVPSLSDLFDTLQKIEDALNSSSGATGEMVKLLREMIPYFEQAGVIASDSLDYMKQAFASMSSGFSHVGDAIGGMHDTMSGLAGKPDLVFPRFNSEGSAAIDTLFSSVSEAADTLSLLNETVKNLGNTAAADIRAINDQLQVIFNLLIDAQNEEGRIDADTLIEDVSGSEDDGDLDAARTEGRIADCVNSAAVEGDIDVGGIVGMMAQEYDFDPEDDINDIGRKSLNFKYKTRAVTSSCINRGSVTAKKDQAGGIVGRMDLGSIVGCQNYGPIASENGDYIGGIAGYSSSVLRSCYSLCSLSGGDYIGGIAGSGSDILNCCSLVTIDSLGEALGAVAGQADGEVNGNCFVGEDLAGIDGISYEGAAVPKAYEDFIRTGGLPSEFKSFQLRFVADEKTVAAIPVAYGSSLSEERIPAVPPKDGYYAGWSDFNFDHITGSAVITAQYTPWVTVISSEPVRADSGLPVFLAEGEFAPDAVLNLTASDSGETLPDGRKAAEVWQVTVTGMKSPAEKLTLRCLTPERDRAFDVFLYEDGGWNKTACEADGSYLVFSAENGSQIALAQKGGNKTALLLAILLPAAFIAVLVFLFLRKRKLPPLRTGRKKKRIAEESPHSPDNG